MCRANAMLYCIGDSMDHKDAAETELVYPTTGSAIGLEQWVGHFWQFPVAVTDSVWVCFWPSA